MFASDADALIGAEIISFSFFLFFFYCCFVLCVCVFVVIEILLENERELPVGAYFNGNQDIFPSPLSIPFIQAKYPPI